MTLDYLIVLPLIAVLSVVQSMFGIGVLVFGTPSLLLLGYDFFTTLGFLLPASFAVSLLQVLTAGSSRVRISRHLYLLCLPGIGVGLWLAKTSPLAGWTNIMVGGMLMLSAVARLWPPSRALTAALLDRHLVLYHLVMGLVHGLTNLGGAMLAILATATNTEKVAIRYVVAHYYLAFSTVQMLVLATVMQRHDLLLTNLPTAAVSASVYLLIGNRIFVRTGNPAYNRALTIFVAAYGVIVLLNT